MDVEELRRRNASLEIAPEDFRRVGYQVVDQMADFLGSLPQRPVTTGETPTEIRELLGQGPLPVEGAAVDSLLEETIELLLDHSLFNGHPRFWGYITSSAAPIGALADFIAGMVNPNVGAWQLSPVASEIETQTVKWIAELLGYPADCGGLLVSGGNMANFVGFLAARNAKVTWDVKKQGLSRVGSERLVAYCSAETHTWIDKAADLHGLGEDAVRKIRTNDNLQIDLSALRDQVSADLAGGFLPFMVVGTAGSTGVGAIDPLLELAEFCREYDLWFHVDAAYGGVAACVPEVAGDFSGMSEADSVVIDPHKWLYTPLEAGCVLVRDPERLRDAYSHLPPSYYKFDQDLEEHPLNYYEIGPQNSRGFRALKVWLAFKQIGREGYVKMISDDILLARELYRLAAQHPALEAITYNLSITTFRYVPENIQGEGSSVEEYLNQLNSELLSRLEKEGQVYLSNAVIRGMFTLRVCIVNFRTSLADIEALVNIVVRVGMEVDRDLRPVSLL